MNLDENLLPDGQPQTEERPAPVEAPGETTVASAAAQPPRATKFCSRCGGKIDEKAVVCPLCGCQVEQITPAVPSIVIHNDNNNTNTQVQAQKQTQTQVQGGFAVQQKKPKDKWVALLLCLFLGWLGGHKFYEGKIGMGVIYLFTCGLFFVGVVIDFIVLLLKPNPYYV